MPTDDPDLDPRWPALLTAARVWRGSLIPNTSSSLASPMFRLIEAIEAFDLDTPSTLVPGEGTGT